MDEAGENGPFEPIRVLITMYEGMDGMDFMGPLEVFHTGRHAKGDARE